MNTKSLILKKGLFSKNNYCLPFPCLVSLLQAPPKQGKTFNNFFWKKNYSNKQIHKGQGLLMELTNGVQFFNDPSAGSPTETLLRLLLPLNDQVCPTFQRSNSVARKESQSEGFTKPFNRQQRRAVCTKGRDVINAS